MRQSLTTAALAALAAVLALEARAAPDAAVTLVLKDHRFSPATVNAPAGRKVRVRLINQDPAAEEFDSRDLGVEEDVTPNGETSFDIGPLKPGRYSFMGEYHATTAEGVVVAGALP